MGRRSVRWGSPERDPAHNWGHSGETKSLVTPTSGSLSQSLSTRIDFSVGTGIGKMSTDESRAQMWLSCFLRDAERLAHLKLAPHACRQVQRVVGRPVAGATAATASIENNKPRGN
jgi:hypothetical protein